MKLPKNITEEEFVQIVEKVVNNIAKKFTFGYRDIEDIKQEAFLLAVKGLKKYDQKRPLANFLYIHIKNRLCNFKRKHYIRLEKPCSRCPLKAFIAPDKCKLYTNFMDCKYYKSWYDRNIVKRNLSHPLEYGQVVDNNTEKNMKYSNDVFGKINKVEVLKIIDMHLPVIYRKHYTMMMNGIKIYKKDEEELKRVILEILNKHGYNPHD